MKRIAITQRIIKNKDYFEIREALDVNWGTIFKKLGFIPIVLPYNYDFRKFDFDGVILSGGNDIGEFNIRDDFEFDLIKYSIQKDIPIFGICRGMQIIAKYFSCSFKNVKNQVGIKHNLVINKDSKYKNILKNIDKVNSYHNIAVNKIDDDFIVSAWNEDKSIIKAIEHKKYKIFGQMWHTERENPIEKDELNLIKNFFINR